MFIQHPQIFHVLRKETILQKIFTRRCKRNPAKAKFMKVTWAHTLK